MLPLIAVLTAGLAAAGGLAFAQPTSNDECLPGSLIHCLGEPLNRTREASIAGLFDPNAMNGTIGSMLLPVNDSMAGEMPMAGEPRQKAMRFSMAQNVTWILGGDWSLSGLNDTETVDFEATFTKVTAEGTMRHAHRIDNFTAISNSTYPPAVGLPTSPPVVSLLGKADLYFDNELAWGQAGISLTLHNGVLTIRFDSADIDNHFHDMPIYGVAK